nr:ATP-binding protein [Leptolyngbya sp. FACHB-321]
MALFGEVTLKIRQSLQLEDILHTTVTEVQRLLQVDRVLIYHVLPDHTGKTISEAVSPEYPALMHLEFPEEAFPQDYQQLYAQGRVRTIANVRDPTAGLATCLVKFVEQFGIKAKLIVPIVQTLTVQTHGNALVQQHLWGLLIAHQCQSTRQWVEFERELMQQLAVHISLALSQAQRLKQLEAVIEARTADLQAAQHNLQQESNGRMQAEAALRQNNECLAIISHELRTPLTSLHSALKILATGRLGNLSAKGQQMLTIADASTERLVRLVNNVLDLQRIESGNLMMQRQACNAAYLLTQAAEAMQPMAMQHGITLVTQLEDISVWADADYILQTLTNLLSNAIKFSPPYGKVWLSVARSDALSPYPAPAQQNISMVGSTESHDRSLDETLHLIPKPVRLHTHAETQARSAEFMSKPLPTPVRLSAHVEAHSPLPEAVFRIRDEGQGIPENQLERIFERFQQVDASDSRQKGGTGLGLAICRNVIEQHSGKIWAESTLGCGSTFVFTLPMPR